MENLSTETANAIATVIFVVISTFSVVLLIERLIDGITGLFRW